MCKRITLSLLLLGTFISTALAEFFVIGDYKYIVLTTNPNTVSVTVNDGVTKSTIKNVVIPEIVTNNGINYYVTELRIYAFDQCSKLSSITIPASVNKISEYAFNQTSSLSTIIFYGATAPTLLNPLRNILTNYIKLYVLSTAAQESFLNSSTWSSSQLNSVIVTQIEINEAVDNSSILEQHDGHTADVVLTRTIRSEGYNSLCLPFSLSAEQVQATFGDDCEIQELSSASVTSEGIDMQFTSCTAIEAGHAYLVKPKATVTNPTIQNVVLTDNVVPTETADVDFIGIFSPTAMTASDNTLILGAGNTLHPTASETMNGLRGYFVLKSSGAKAAAKKQIKMSFNSANTTTDMSSVSSAQGLLIRKQIINGQLHIVRGEVHYNAQGMKIE